MGNPVTAACCDDRYAGAVRRSPAAGICSQV